MLENEKINDLKIDNNRHCWFSPLKIWYPLHNFNPHISPAKQAFDTLVKNGSQLYDMSWSENYPRRFDYQVQTIEINDRVTTEHRYFYTCDVWLGFELIRTWNNDPDNQFRYFNYVANSLEGNPRKRNASDVLADIHFKKANKFMQEHPDWHSAVVEKHDYKRWFVMIFDGSGKRKKYIWNRKTLDKFILNRIEKKNAKVFYGLECANILWR